MSKHRPDSASIAINTVQSVYLATSHPTITSLLGTHPRPSAFIRGSISGIRHAPIFRNTPAESSRNCAMYSCRKTSDGKVRSASTHSRAGKYGDALLGNEKDV